MRSKFPGSKEGVTLGKDTRATTAEWSRHERDLQTIFPVCHLTPSHHQALYRAFYPSRTFLSRQEFQQVGAYPNIRTSNSNGCGFRNLIFEKSPWAGFNSTFHSPRMAAEGTSKAAVCPARIQSSPKRRRDSSLVSCQFVGRVFRSTLEISSPSGILPSVEIRSFGCRFGSRFTKVSTAASANEVEAYTIGTPRLFQRPP